MNLLGFSFGEPAWLLLLLGLLPLGWWLSQRGPVPAVRYPAVRLLGATRPGPRVQPGRRWRFAPLLVPSLLVLALARPHVERSFDEENAKGIDIMLVLDASRSMDSRDFDLDGHKVSRREALQRVMGEFIRSRTHDRIGVVAFAEKPFLVCPLTLDHSWMMEALENVRTSLGTAIGSGVEAGVDLLVRNGQGTKIAILVTDGLNTSGTDPLESAQVARRFGVRLYTIGAVNYEEMQTSHLDEITLYRMAQMTGGQFFQAANGNALAAIYHQIDQAERTEFRQPRLVAYRELFPWCAVGAFVLLAVQLVDRTGRRMRLP